MTCETVASKHCPQLSLEQVYRTFNIVIAFAFLIFFIMVASSWGLMNNLLFNTFFGNEIFLTCFIVIVVSIFIKAIVSNKANAGLKVWCILFILISSIIMLSASGVFSKNPPENNIAIMTNIGFLVAFFAFAGFIYKNATCTEKEQRAFLNNSAVTKARMKERAKYSLLLMLVIFGLVILYFVNPLGIMTNFAGPTLFASIFLIIFFAIMIQVYQYIVDTLAAAPTTNAANKMNIIPPSFTSWVLKTVYLLGTLSIALICLYYLLKYMGLFDQKAVSNVYSWPHIILNVLILAALVGALYKMASAYGLLKEDTILGKIGTVLMLIPRFFLEVINNARRGTPNSPTNNRILFISVTIATLYFVWTFYLQKVVRKTYYKHGGNQLINEPIGTNELTNVATYQSLNDGKDAFNYQYAISFWVYLDSFPPTKFNNELTILSFGENPCVRYDATTNQLFVTVKQPGNRNSSTIMDYKAFKDASTKEAIESAKQLPLGKTTDDKGNRIIYELTNVLLQKWNHIVLNYSGGTLDVFYNGKLVKSAIEVVPYLNHDMLSIGQENGLHGSVANVVYFNQPLSITTINSLYTNFQNKNPPIV